MISKLDYLINVCELDSHWVHYISYLMLQLS